MRLQLPSANRRVRLEHQRHEQPLDRGGIMGDLVIGIGADLGCMLQTIERRFAGQPLRNPGACASAFCRGRRAQDHGATGRGRRCPLVAERDAENALAEHHRKLVHDERPIASILETIGQPRHQVDRLVGLPQQQRARIRRDRAAIERAHDIAAPTTFAESAPRCDDLSSTVPKSNESGIHSVGIGVALAPA